MRRGSHICLSKYALLYYFRVHYPFYDVVNYCTNFLNIIVFVYLGLR